MVEDCALGAENKTRINGLIKVVDETKVCLNKKISSLFVGCGIFVLACILGFIYTGQREISKDITMIKIEQGKITNQFATHEYRINRLDNEVSEMRRKKVKKHQ